jgi:hypothetical protein
MKPYKKNNYIYNNDETYSYCSNIFSGSRVVTI